MKRLISLIAAALGIRLTRDWVDEANEPIFFLGAVIAVGVLAWLVWFMAKVTSPAADQFADEPADFVRGGCVLIIVAGLGLIFTAALIWAWRYLFGN